MPKRVPRLAAKTEQDQPDNLSDEISDEILHYYDRLRLSGDSGTLVVVKVALARTWRLCGKPLT